MPLFRGPDVEKLYEKRDVPGIIGALSHKDRLVRAKAADALRLLREPSGLEPLIATLKDVDALVRLRTVEALGALGDVRAVEPLISAMNTYAEGRQLRLAAALSLGLIGDPGAVQGVVSFALDPSVMVDAIVPALAGLPEAAVSARLLEIVKSRVIDDRTKGRATSIKGEDRALELLDRLGYSTDEVMLAEYLREAELRPVRDRRTGAFGPAMTVGRVSGLVERNLEQVVALLEGPDADLRSAAAQLLDVALATRASIHDAVRSHARRTAREGGATGALVTLVRAAPPTSDDDVPIVEALGRSGDPAFLDIVVRAHAEGTEDLKAAALDAARAIAPNLDATWLDGFEAAADPGKALKSLPYYVKSRSVADAFVDSHNSFAVRALIRAAMPDVLDEVIHRIDTTVLYEEFGLKVTGELSRRGESIIPALHEHLVEKKEGWAVHALAEIGTDEAVRVLGEALQVWTGSEELIVRALRRIGTPAALRSLYEVLAGPKGATAQSAIIRAIAETRDPAAVGALADGYNGSEGEVIQETFDVLEGILSEKVGEISTDDLRKVLTLEPKTFGRTVFGGEDRGPTEVVNFDVVVDPARLHQMAAVELRLRDVDHQRIEQGLSPRDWAIQEIVSKRGSIVAAILEMGYGRIGLDHTGHPRAGAFLGLVRSTVEEAVAYVHETGGLADPRVLETAKRKVASTAHSEVVKRHGDPPANWHRDPQMLGSIARTLAEAAIEAYVSVLQGAEQEPERL